VPIFQLPRIQFFDIQPLQKDPRHFRTLTQDFLVIVNLIDVVAGIKAQSLILGSSVALTLDKGFVPLLKKWQLPPATSKESFILEYGTDALET
jgi:adenine phosphoribosyltransferase